MTDSSYQQSGVGNTILKKDNPKIQNKYSLDAPYARLRGDVQEIQIHMSFIKGPMTKIVASFFNSSPTICLIQVVNVSDKSVFGHMKIKKPRYPMGVLHSFSIKNTFYDKMDLRLFYFGVTYQVNIFSLYPLSVFRVYDKEHWPESY